MLAERRAPASGGPEVATGACGFLGGDPMPRRHLAASSPLMRPPQPERLDAETGDPSRGPARKLGEQSSTLGGATELRTRGDLPLDELVLLVAMTVDVDGPAR